jgi:hypothetical protein
VFRLMQLKPPQGWIAVAWELAIVTLGVLIALATQQWADERIWLGKVETSKAALRDELSEHYSNAVEFRTVYPCLQAQLAKLRGRVLASGAVMEPAPIYQESGSDFVLRIPSKEYPTDVWEAAVNDGTMQRLEPTVRRQLAGHYTMLATILNMRLANDQSEKGLSALAHRLPLDPTVRYSIIKEIEQLSGRLEYLDLLNGQVIDYLQKANMLPSSGEARSLTERYGTYRFCKAQSLPMRSFEEAMEAVPSDRSPGGAP